MVTYVMRMLHVAFLWTHRPIYWSCLRRVRPVGRVICDIRCLWVIRRFRQAGRSVWLLSWVLVSSRKLATHNSKGLGCFCASPSPLVIVFVSFCLWLRIFFGETTACEKPLLQMRFCFWALYLLKSATHILQSISFCVNIKCPLFWTICSSFPQVSCVFSYNANCSGRVV